MTIRKELKMLPWILLCVCILAIAHAKGISMLVYASLVGFLTIFVVAKETEIIYLLLFFLPWSAIIKTAPTAISFCSISTLLVFFIFCFFKGHSRIGLNQLFAVGGITVISVISSVIHGYGIATSHIMFILMLLLYPILLSYLTDKVDFEIATFFFSIGIISATIVSLAFSDNQNINNFVRVLADDRFSVVRYCGFYADPNFYAAQIVAAIGCQLIVLLHKKTGTFANILLVMGLVVCGATSVSKSFLICLFVIVLIWLYCLMKKNPTKLVKTLFYGAIIIGAVLVSGLFSDIINQFITRLDASDNISSLTTGRAEIWKEYLLFFINNPAELFLGQGYTSVFNTVHKGSHNTIIQLIYQLGLVGSLLFMMWFRSTIKIKCLRKLEFSLWLLLGVSCFSMWLGLDMLFYDDFFLIIVLYTLGINYLFDQQNLMNCVT